MSMSGVTVDDTCIKEFTNIKMGKAYKYIIFRISDDKTHIIVDSLGPKESSGTPTTAEQLSEFAKVLPVDNCRYVVYDFIYSGSENQLKAKLLFIAWCPDTSPIKLKMLYAASKDGLKRKLEGALKEVQCSDAADLSFNNVLDICTRGEK